MTKPNILRLRRATAPFLALIAVALVASACSSSGGGQSAVTKTETTTKTTTTTAPPATSSTTSTPPSTTTTSKAPGKPAKKVQVTSLLSDGETYGVGMPIVLFFSPAPTDSTAFTKAVKVTVNGHAAAGAWYWEQPTADEVKSHTIEAHFRLQSYWPADSRVHVAIPIGGLSAGKGLVYWDKLTSLDFTIGDSHISTVDGSTGILDMRVTSNGKLVNTIPVSLGAAATPTFTGVKVVMQKGEDLPGTNTLRPNGTVLMNGPGYSNDPVQWSVRITRSGEYVHAAPWNGEIGARSTSNGCTNLHVKDALWFYKFAQIGDVVTYANTGGTRMPTWDGLGDWNVPWLLWRQGGLLLNH